MKKIISTLIMTLALCGAANAQVSDYYQLRTNSWSIYGLGGVSAATGQGLYSNVSPSADTYVAPMGGLGVTWNIRPWVRFDLGTEASKYLREQRWSKPQADGVAYRSLNVFYDDVELAADFNLAQIFRKKGQAGRFNVWLGTGIGGMFAFGSDYAISMGQKETIDPDPKNDNYTFTAWLKAHNEGVKGASAYIPANLSVEYDITPRFTLGLRGSAKYILNGGKDMLPDWTESVGAVLRVNFVGKKHGYTSRKRQVARLESDLATAAATCELLTQTNTRLGEELSAKTAENNEIRKTVDEIQASLDNCGADAETVARLRKEIRDLKAEEFTVYFANASAKLDKKSLAIIEAAAARMEADEEAIAVITASCSTTGSEEYNKALSDRRAEAVRQALINAGVKASSIADIISLGEEGMTSSEKCRRAIIDVR